MKEDTIKLNELKLNKDAPWPNNFNYKDKKSGEAVPAFHLVQRAHPHRTQTILHLQSLHAIPFSLVHLEDIFSLSNTLIQKIRNESVIA